MTDAKPLLTKELTQRKTEEKLFKSANAEFNQDHNNANIQIKQYQTHCYVSNQHLDQTHPVQLQSPTKQHQQAVDHF